MEQANKSWINKSRPLWSIDPRTSKFSLDPGFVFGPRVHSAHCNDSKHEQGKRAKNQRYSRTDSTPRKTRIHPDFSHSAVQNPCSKTNALLRFIGVFELSRACLRPSQKRTVFSACVFFQAPPNHAFCGLQSMTEP